MSTAHGRSSSARASAGSQIALALVEAGARELVIHDANPLSVSTLVERLTGLAATRVSGGPPDPAGSDLVFNATPMGMQSGDPVPINTALLTVGDVIAGHGETPFIQTARDAGCSVATGVHMVKAE